MFRIVENFDEYGYPGLENNFLSSGRLALTIILSIGALIGLTITSIATELISEIYGQQASLLPVGIFISIIGLLISLRMENSPKRIVFDSTKRRLILLDRQDTKLSDAPSISYEAFESLRVEKHISNNGKRSSTNYLVTLRKYDLSEWTLITSRSRTTAEGYRERISQLMCWNNHTEGESDTEESTSTAMDQTNWSFGDQQGLDSQNQRRFDVDRKEKQSHIKWSIKRSTSRKVGIAILLLGLSSILVGDFALSKGLSLITIFVGILIFFILRGISRFESQRWVKIDSEGLKASSPTRLFRRPKEVDLSHNELYGIGFDLSNIAQLKLITHEAYKVIKEHKQRDQSDPLPDLGSVLALARLMFNMPIIDSSGLMASESLTLEALIEAEFRRVHGRELE